MVYILYNKLLYKNFAMFTKSSQQFCKALANFVRQNSSTGRWLALQEKSDSKILVLRGWFTSYLGSEKAWQSFQVIVKWQEISRCRFGMWFIARVLGGVVAGCWKENVASNVNWFSLVTCGGKGTMHSLLQ